MSGGRNSPSRRRYRARKKAEREARFAEMRAAGKSCGNCKHFSARKRPGVSGSICELHSDFEGYSRAKLEGLCLDHKTKETE